MNIKNIKTEVGKRKIRLNGKEETVRLTGSKKGYRKIEYKQKKCKQLIRRKHKINT